jgi:hypothetical protein
MPPFTTVRDCPLLRMVQHVARSQVRPEHSADEAPLRGGKSSVPQDRGRTRLRDSIESHLTIVFAALAFSREARARNIFVRKGAAGHCPGLPAAPGDPD